MDRKSRDVGTVEADTALVRHDFAAEQTHKRRLAGSVRTNDCVNFVRSNVEHDRICSNHTAEAPGQALSLQKRSNHNYERLCGGSRPTNCLASAPRRQSGHNTQVLIGAALTRCQLVLSPA